MSGDDVFGVVFFCQFFEKIVADFAGGFFDSLFELFAEGSDVGFLGKELEGGGGERV